MVIKQAVILAGGRGTRLDALTHNKPKPMVEVNGRPFLEYLIELLKDNGIQEVVLLLGYLADKIVNHFGDGSKFGLKIKYSIGVTSWETGTLLRDARPLLDDKFLLMYCDNYWPLNLKKMSSFYYSAGLSAMVTVYNNKDGSGEYGPENNVHVDDAGRILLYDRSRKDPRLNATDIGFFILDKEILKEMPPYPFSFEEEILPVLIKERKLAGYRTDHPYYPITNLELLKKTERFLIHKKVVFLDRDGVINKKMPEHDFVKSWEEFEFLPNVVEAIKLLKKNNYQIFVVTNQAGISRNMMTIEGLNEIHVKMCEAVNDSGGRIERIYCCTHGYADGCDCRKPKPGLFFEAARQHNLDLTKCVFIGDSETDLRAGEAAGCKTILVSAGRSLLDVAASLI